MPPPRAAMLAVLHSRGAHDTMNPERTTGRSLRAARARDNMFNHILVTLDGSELAERAIGHATELALAVGASVTLLSVVHQPDSPSGASSTGTEEEQRAPWIEYLDKQAEMLRAAGVADVRTELRAGDAARTIADGARELQVQLIVMSTQGLGADGRDALGSVASEVLMTAPCPVLMVRAETPEPPRSVAEERWQEEGGANVG
jgi:nucleotide-binding universal stress UspA family protein